jgi:CheY-specific phosphatase CheX
VDTITPFKSDVSLIIEKEYSEEIVMEMTGGDIENITEEIIFDALSELSNTIVGRFLSRVVPENSEFSLGFPECKTWDPVTDNFERAESVRLFALEMEETNVYCIIETK